MPRRQRSRSSSRLAGSHDDRFSPTSPEFGCLHPALKGPLARAISLSSTCCVAFGLAPLFTGAAGKPMRVWRGARDQNVGEGRFPKAATFARRYSPSTPPLPDVPETSASQLAEVVPHRARARSALRATGRRPSGTRSTSWQQFVNTGQEDKFTSSARPSEWICLRSHVRSSLFRGRGYRLHKL